MDEITCKHKTEDILRTLKSNQCYMELIPERRTLDCENNLKSWNLISPPKDKQTDNKQTLLKGEIDGTNPRKNRGVEEHEFIVFV